MPPKCDKTFPQIKACKAIIKQLLSRKYKDIAWVFYDPIEPHVLGLDDYFDKVKEPMDLSTIKCRLNAGFYSKVNDFAKDVRLVFYNTYVYTCPTHLCYEMAVKLEKIFEDLYAKVPQEATEDMQVESSDSDADSDSNSDSDSTSSSNDDSDTSRSASPEPAVELPAVTANKSFSRWSDLKRSYDQALGEAAAKCNQQPMTAAEDLDLHVKMQQLDGEVLLKVIHMIHQMEGINTNYNRKELEIDVSALKTQTKRSIMSYLVSKGITGKRARRGKYNYN